MAPVRDRRPGFSRRAQYGLFFTYVLAVSGAVVGAVLLGLSFGNPQVAAPLRLAVAEVTTPVSTAMSFVVRTVAAVPEGIGTWIRVHGENAELRAQVERSRHALFAGRAAQLENVRLRRLLAIREQTSAPVATARVVSTSASSTRRFGTIDAGHWQGVAEGQPVRSGDGLIGRVIEVGPNTARVLLITDPESVIPVRRLRDDKPAIAAGRGDGLVDIRSVDTGNADIRAGDIFVTSGSGGLFSPGVPVARALRAGPDAVPARPFARPDGFDYAIVSRAYLPPLPPPAATPPEAAPPPSSPPAAVQTIPTTATPPRASASARPGASPAARPASTPTPARSAAPTD